MRSYKDDLSRRLGPVFAEQVAQPKTTSTRNLSAHEGVCLTPELASKFYGVSSGRVPSAAYKPTHGGYPSAGARA